MQAEFLADVVHHAGWEDFLAGTGAEALEVVAVLGHPAVEGAHGDAGGHGNLAL